MQEKEHGFISSTWTTKDLDSSEHSELIGSLKLHTRSFTCNMSLLFSSSFLRYGCYLACYYMPMEFLLMVSVETLPCRMWLHYKQVENMS